jgi:hypothetical protein
MSASLAIVVGIVWKGFVSSHLTADGYAIYMSVWGLKVVDPALDRQMVQVSVVPRRDARDLVLDVIVQNFTSKSFWISEITLGRVRITLSDDKYDIPIPFKSYPVKKSLRKEDRIVIPSGHSVRREFKVLDYYWRPRMFKFVSVELLETQLGKEGPMLSARTPLPPSKLDK